MILSRIAWTAWAILPVIALTYHFGPGQRAFNEGKASKLIAEARQAQTDALAAQDAAYAKHLAAITARRAAFGKDDHELSAAARRAGEEEDAAYAFASAAWQRTADSLGQAQTLMAQSSAPIQQQVRLVRARALVRAGDIGAGANELEELIEANPADPGSDLVLQAREELATAYYYGARLMRLAGRPGEEWREISGRARQNYRYLAEHAQAAGKDDATIANHQKNGELVLNLEQSSLNELYASARPKDSPPGAGSRLGTRRPGRGRRPGPDPGAGAGLEGEIGQGW